MPTAVDQHIGGLYIAVGNQVLVQVGDAVAQLREQVEALRQGQPPVIGVAVDGQAIDELHGQPRQALARGAAIEEPRDVRVRHLGEQLPLAAKAAD